MSGKILTQFNRPPQTLATPTFRGIREASIPVTAPVAGVHTISFTNRYAFGAFSPAGGMYGSLIHGNVHSAEGLVANLGGQTAAYFSAGATTTDPTLTQDDERNFVPFSPPAIAGDPIHTPMLAGNKLDFTFSVLSAVVSDIFTVTLYRGAAASDLAAVLGGGQNGGQVVRQWGPVQGVNGTSPYPSLVVMDAQIPAGACWWVELQNVSSAVNLNKLVGSILIHG